MLLIAAVAALATAGVSGGSDVDALAQLWSGIRDSSEQVFSGTEASVSPWGLGAERRVRTVVAPVSAPWLGPHVLYLEEFLHDEPDNVRRQLLLQLEPAEPPNVGVEVHLFTFREPGRWVHLGRRPERIARLHRSAITPVAGCDLRFKREGDQFMGGTLGRRCIGTRDGASRYVDYQLVIGDDLYWYRRRVLMKPGDDVLEDVIGFNWFELNEARLFTCRVDWSATGRRSDLRPLLRLDLHDQGGQGHFATPDGRRLQLTLHSQDWPFMSDRDALILLVQDQSEPEPLATAWTQIDDDEVGVDLGWLRVTCGSLIPDTDEVWSSVPMRPVRPGRLAGLPPLQAGRSSLVSLLRWSEEARGASDPLTKDVTQCLERAASVSISRSRMGLNCCGASSIRKCPVCASTSALKSGRDLRMRAASVGARSELMASTGTWMSASTGARSSPRSACIEAIPTSGGSSDMS